MKRLRDILFFVIACSIIVACKPGVPKGIIKPGKMEDILFDIHVADGMVQNNPTAVNNIEYNRTLYRLGVLKKYNVTRQSSTRQWSTIPAILTACMKYMKEWRKNLTKRHCHLALLLPM